MGAKSADLSMIGHDARLWTHGVELQFLQAITVLQVNLFLAYMATTSSHPLTASAKIHSKASKLSDLFRGHQHSSAPPPLANSSNKLRPKLPLFSLWKKSPVPCPGQPSPTLTSVHTPRLWTNLYVFCLSKFEFCTLTAHVFDM